MILGGLLAGVVLAVLLVMRRIAPTYVPYGPFLILGAIWAILLTR